MAIQHSPLSIAEKFGIEIPTLSTFMRRKKLVQGRFDRNEILEDDVVEVLLNHYDKTGAKRKDTTVQIVAQKDRVINDKTRTAKVKKDKTVRAATTPIQEAIAPNTTNVFTTQEKAIIGIVSFIALTAMFVQMHHTAAIVGGELLDGWLYAFSIQFTGLALTLFKGGLNYLRVFAASEFLVNMLYFRPWANCVKLGEQTICGGWEIWTKSILLSFLLMIAIFSFVAIYEAILKGKTT